MRGARLWLFSCLAMLVPAIGVGAGSTAAASSPLTVVGVLVQTLTAPGAVAGHDEVFSLPVGGLARSYRLFVPASLGSNRARLLVMLHPLHGSASAMETTTNLDAGAAKLNVLVAYPSGVGGSWNAGTCCDVAQRQGVDDVAFLDAVIDDVARHYDVDSSHLALGGFSNGGLMTYRYACERSARIQTFVVASGVPVAPACTFSRPVAVLHMHGIADPIVPWLGTTSSPYLSTGLLPAIGPAVSGIAARDGCTGWSSTLLPAGSTRWRAAGCPTGASVDLFTSPTLGHFWVTGAAAALFQLDETGLTWSFVLSH